MVNIMSGLILGIFSRLAGKYVKMRLCGLVMYVVD